MTPSQCIYTKSYDVWVILIDCGDIPGGQLLQAYCPCTDGMLGSCNNIPVGLFKMEHAIKYIMTMPASTRKVYVDNSKEKDTNQTTERIRNNMEK